MNSTQLVLLIMAGYGVLLLMMMAAWVVYIVSVIRIINKELKEREKE